MNQLRQHLFFGAEGTKSGGRIGLEIETDFVTELGQPISESVTAALLAPSGNQPAGTEIKLELGRQKIELAIAPANSFERLWEQARQSLDWLYRKAASLGAYPCFEPEIRYDGRLLFVTDERDSLWVELDGKEALENLCRCSSVQFTIDVNPDDAIGWINLLWDKKIFEVDYAVNDRLWRRYINESRFGYSQTRYAGPIGFESQADYLAELCREPVVMHQGIPCRQTVEMVRNLDCNLFLRSIWWHFRLKRFGNALAVEIRPFSRRSDEDIPKKWAIVAATLGL